MNALILDRSVRNGYSPSLAAGLRAAGVKVVVGVPAGTEVGLGPAVYPRAGVAGRRAVKLYDLARGLVRLAALARRLRPDVVHVQWPETIDVLYLRIVRLLSNPAVVYTAHNPFPRSGESLHRQDELLRRANCIIVHSQVLADALRASHSDLSGSVHVVPIGNYERIIRRYDRIHARRELGLDPEVPIFAFVGLLRPYKGIETLLDAFALHRARGLPGQVVIAGTVADSRYVASLREHAAGLGEAVIWKTSRDAVPQRMFDLVLSASTQVVLPFHEATQSASLLLALTHGRCVVSTDVGAIPETVGDCAVIVPARDTQRLSDALSLTVSAPAFCDELGAKGRSLALEHFSWEEIGRKTLSVYARAADLQAANLMDSTVIPSTRRGCR